MSRMIGVLACLMLLSTPVSSQTESEAADAIQGTPLSQVEALEAWNVVYEVFSHPRCSNCHVGDDNRPRWSGPSYGITEGDWRFHGMNVVGGESRIGAETQVCSACHQVTNAPIPHGPPGAPHWQLAPVEMVWWRKSSAGICEQIQDPERTGGRDLAEVADHIGHDALVLWAWDPGPGREVPPNSAQDTVSAFLNWAASGAPCPDAG